MSTAALPRESEKDVQRKCYELCVRCNCAVYWMSQARETQQTPGVPDLLVGFTHRWIITLSTTDSASSPRLRVKSRCFNDLLRRRP